MTEQGYQPRQAGHPGRPGRPGSPQESRRSGWQGVGAFPPDVDAETDLPPWAGPGALGPVRPARPPRGTQGDPPPGLADDQEPGEGVPARSGRRLGRSRVAAARRRRSRRRLLTWGVVAVGIVVIAGAWLYLVSQPATRSGPVTITTLRSGEYRTVPDACRVLSGATLAKFVGGTPKGVQTFGYPDQSQCGYTFDAKPTFRVLSVTIQAYQPYLGVPGNGSATANAAYTFAQRRHLLAEPPKHTPQPPATVAVVPGLGNAAFSAVQVFHVGGVTDRATVLVLYRNVLITASLEAQVSGGFGPVTVSELRAGAITAARDLLAAVKVKPAIGS